MSAAVFGSADEAAKRDDEGSDGMLQMSTSLAAGEKPEATPAKSTPGFREEDFVEFDGGDRSASRGYWRDEDESGGGGGG